MKPPEFLKVLPADVGRVGGLGACILAAVRYMTALPGEANGRRVIDGVTWWRASYDAIAQAVGDAPPRTVGSTVRRMLETGDLAAIPVQDFRGDRAKAYKAVDQPSAESAELIPIEELEEPSGGKNPPSPPGDDGIVDAEFVDDDEPTPPARLPARRTGSEVARTRFAAIPAQRSELARQTLDAWTQAPTVLVDARTRREVGVEIDRCLHDGFPPAVIVAGLHAWHTSNSWAPSQIPRFVTKVAALQRPHNGVGKAGHAADGYLDAAETLIAQMEAQNGQ